MMQKGYEALSGEEKNEAEVFQGAICSVSLASSVSFFSGGFTLPIFYSSALWKLPRLLRKCLNVCSHSVKAAVLQTVAPLMVHVMTGSNTYWVSKDESFGWSRSGFCANKKVMIKLKELVLFNFVSMYLFTAKFCNNIFFIPNLASD